VKSEEPFSVVPRPVQGKGGCGGGVRAFSYQFGLQAIG